MPVTETVAVVSALISLGSLLMVVLQLRENNAQRQMESLIRISEVNRELITLGFSHPDLFDVLKDAEAVDPELERRYLQLWINQLSLMHSMHCHSRFAKEVQTGLVRSVRDFMSLKNMRRQWRSQRPFHPGPFREFVDRIVEEIERDAEPGGQAR